MVKYKNRKKKNLMDSNELEVSNSQEQGTAQGSDRIINSEVSGKTIDPLESLKSWMEKEGNEQKTKRDTSIEDFKVKTKEVTPLNTAVFQHSDFRKEVHEMDSNTTVIGKGVEITGDIKLEGSLELYGKILGNIDSKGDINMASSAVLEGKLRGNNLNISAGNVNGNLTLDSDAQVGTQSRIIGDIQARTLNSSGIIMGNVFVSEKIVLNSTSVIEGNIQTRELEVQSGAVIKGQIEVNSK